MTAKTAQLTRDEVAAAVRRVLAGDVEAYTALYRAFDPRLRAWLGKRFRGYGPDFVEEVASLTHQYALAHLGRFDPARAEFVTWLILCSRNRASAVRAAWYDARRTRCPDGTRAFEPRLVAFDEETIARYIPAKPGPEEAARARERDRILMRAYRRLSRRGRLSVACHDLGGLSHRQTAARLGTSEMTARRIRSRALLELDRALRASGVRILERDTTSGLVRTEEEDDDWCATVTAPLPVGPRTLTGAKEE